MVSTVAAGLNSLLPVDVPEEVLAAALDSALVAAGIPPNIPDLNGLMEENLDYVADLAVAELTTLPPGSDIAADELKLKDAITDGMRAGVKAAQAAATGAGPGTPCDTVTDPPYFLVGLENRSQHEYRDVHVDVLHSLFERRESTVPLLKPGQRVTIPVVLPCSQRLEFWDGQLYDEGAWWEAYRTEEYTCSVLVTVTSGPYGQRRPLGSYQCAKRLWNEQFAENR